MARYVIIDGAVVPVGRLEQAVRAAKRHDSALHLTSCYRGEDAKALLHRTGHHTQAEVYWLSIHHVPGYGPANPPGRSTHEMRSDGVAYAGPVGRKLAPWQTGMDWAPSGSRAATAMRRAGIVATLTYPNSRGEAQHINIRRRPPLATRFRSLKRGSRGARVVRLTTMLRDVRRPDRKHHYLPHRYMTFNETVEHAVRQYQRDHDLKVDGIVGKHTWAQLQASARYWKKHR